MTPADLLEHAAELGVEVRAEDGFVKLRGPAAALDALAYLARPIKRQLLALLPSDRDTAAICTTCRHRTIYRNCGAPVDAGLADRFQLVACPTTLAACPAYEHPIEARLMHLLALGAIDEADAQLVRSEYQAYPEEWDQLLDAAEAALRRSTPTHTHRRSA